MLLWKDVSGDHLKSTREEKSRLSFSYESHLYASAMLNYCGASLSKITNISM